MAQQRKLDINVRPVNGISVVELSDNIDFYNAPVFKGVINSLIGQGKKLFIINLAKITHIDSSGIGALITTMLELEKMNGSLKISGLGKPVKKVFDMTQAITLFEVYDTEAEALESFKKTGKK
jgi:anti-sigma B factor antagonist